MIDYLSIINKYIDPASETYKYYFIHTTLVTKKALTIANNMGLPDEQKGFIEEAAMLHDIGIVETHTPLIGCYGDKPYIQHMPIGKEILINEGLPKHAEIAEKHTSITKAQILRDKLPLEPKDIYPTSLEGEIIAFSDMFFTKDPSLLWQEKSIDLVLSECEQQYGNECIEFFGKWLDKFGQYV